MANDFDGKFWVLDTAGLIVDGPVFVKNVQVTWKVSSAGALEITEFNHDSGAGKTFVYAKTLGASSAAIDQLTQVIQLDQWVNGFNLKTITDIDKLIVNVA